MKNKNIKYKNKRYKIVNYRVRRNVYTFFAVFFLALTMWQLSVLLNDITGEYKPIKIVYAEVEKEKELTISDHVWKIMHKEYKLSYDEKVKAFDIIKCESNWNVYAIGDDGASRGLWQIHNHYNPDVTNACAFDVYCSTRKAMEIYQQWENFEAWTCNDLI